MVKKKIFAILFIILGIPCILVLLSSCGDNIKNDEYYEVMLLDGNHFSVSDNIVLVEKGGDAIFDVNIEEGYDFVDLSGGKYINGKYTLSNILYDRTITLQTKKITSIDFLIENGIAEILRVLDDSGKLLIGNKVEIRVIADDNYGIDSIFLNDEMLDVTVEADRYSTFIVELEDTNVIDCNIVGDKYNLNINYNNNFGTIQYEKKDIYRYGDEIIISAIPNAGYVLNYWDINGKITTNSDSISITIDNDINLKIDFCSINARRITYDANGGGLISGVLPIVAENGQSIYIDNGYKKFYRENYSLVGFNTKNDGSGISHSLGAMISLSDDYQILYAMWEKWTEKEMLEYSLNDSRNGYIINGLSLRGKNSNILKLVIPEQIDGIPVTQIKRYAFEGDNTIEEVVVSSSVSDVESFSFYKMSRLYKITLFDNIRNIWNDSISDNPNLDILKINSATRRVYEYQIESSYVDKQMHLKTSKKKKIITISGCSHARGLDASEILKDSQFGDYDFVIMGVHAGYGLFHIFETIQNYINNGDIVVFSPELRDDMFGNAIGGSHIGIWLYLESNYDLTQEFRLKNNYNGKLNILSLFGEYIDNKKYYLDNDYYIAPDINRFNSVDKYGYFDYYRPNSIEFGYEFNEESRGLFATKSLIGDGITYINEFAAKVQSKGAKIYYTYPPVYKYKDYNNPTRVEERKEFEIAISDALIFKSIGRVSDFAYGPEFLFEHVNHCSTTGVAEYTRDLKNTLKLQLFEDGLL